MTQTLVQEPQMMTKQEAAGAPQYLLGEYPTYAGAERVVDKLSDAGFPVERARIVGTGLRSVEYVTGRFTRGRAALAGAGSGAWFGLLVGLLLGLFAPVIAWFPMLLVSVLIGVGWGALFGYLAHAGTRGRRDFASVRNLEANQYAVYVDAAFADEARRLAETS